jgi:hypothetical protein
VEERLAAPTNGRSAGNGPPAGAAADRLSGETP